MSDAFAIFFWVLVLIAVYVLTRHINFWRTSRASRAIIEELDSREAHDPLTAVALDAVQRNFLRTGLRNFRPEGLKLLLASDMVGMTHEGKFYLKRRAARRDG